MFSETNLQSQGSYEVSQEICRLLNTIQAQKDHYADWSNQIQEGIVAALLTCDTLSPAESDVSFCLVQADFFRLSRGTPSVSEENKLLTVLGYRLPPEGEGDDKKKSTKLQATFTDAKETLVGFYYNAECKEQQEIIEVPPHSVKPVPSFDLAQDIALAKHSAMMKPEILVKLVTVLKEDSSRPELQV